MCRILGFVGAKEISIETMQRAAARQNKGGPDAQTFKMGEGFGLSNNRLAVQGIDGGVQPFHLDGLYAVYNGEIYNHRQLRQQLRQLGYHFSDECDGNVILPLYQHYGEAFVRYLDGMFTIALMDRVCQKMIIVNDPCAVKSVYFHYDTTADQLYFSSEIDALFEFPIQKTLRARAVHEYIVGRALWHDKTFFEEVHALPARSVMVKTPGKAPQLRQYDSLMDKKMQKDSSFIDAALQFDALFESQIVRMMQADVPVCLVISGGLDSSYVTSLAAKHQDNLTAFHIGYEGNWPLDEVHYAKEVADFCKVRFHPILIKENEFPDLLSKTIDALGQPNTAPHALSTYALFSTISEQGYKVALTGEGADEFFGGYTRFQTAMFDARTNWFEHYYDVISATTDAMRSSIYSQDFQQSLMENSLIENTRTLIMQQEQYKGSRLQAILGFDQTERFPAYILRRVDHLSMANSLEVRVPFCQPGIISFARSLPDEYLVDEKAVKKILYEASKNKVPESVLHRAKQPFTLPIVAMLQSRHVLFEILQDTLRSHAFNQRGFFNPKDVAFLLEQQATTPNAASSNMLWSLLILELWLQRHQLDFK